MSRKILMTAAMALLVTILAACAGSTRAREQSEVTKNEAQEIKTQVRKVAEPSVELVAATPTAAPIESEQTQSGTEAGENEQNEVAVNSTASLVAEKASAGWINGSNVNLRLSPSLESQVLDVLNYRQELLLLSTANGWGFVNTEGNEGYVYLEFVTVSDNAAELVAKHGPMAEVTQNGFTVAIDAGHQAKGNNEHEPIGPGAEETKPKVSSGTQGTTTNVPEYKLTLEVSLKLRDELSARGYNVFMIREMNEVDISNRERADMATNAGADILVRIHADGSENSNVNGILTLCPTENNCFVPDLYVESRQLSDDILSTMVEATGAKNRGVMEVDNMSGINWSTMPVTIVEMGLMTNPTEDELMQTEEYQQKIVMGIANGVEKYFKEE